MVPARIVALALLMALASAASTSSPAVAGSKRRGSFMAHAYPYPTLDCGSKDPDEGIDGVTKVSRRFKAPVEGFLTVAASDFAGDWDLAVVIGEEPVAGSVGWQLTGDPPREEVTVGLRKNTVVKMYACNHASWQLDLKVTYMFEPKPLGY